MDPRESAKQVQKTGLDVGFLCAGWPPDVGGVESHAQDLARALATRGHRVHVFCLDTSGMHEPFSTQATELDGVRVRRLAYAYGDHDRLAAVVVNLKAEDAIHGWLAETPCDVVHVHHLTGFGMGALRAVSDIGVPCVMTLHDYWSLCPRGQMLSASGAICERPETEACATCLTATWPHLMPSGSGLSKGPRNEELADDGVAVDKRTAFALEMLRLPHRLFTPSAAARDVYERAGFDGSSLAVCENGVEVAELAQQVERLRSERSEGSGAAVRLGILGTVLPSKGVLELARVFADAAIAGLTLEIHGNLPTYHGDASYLTELKALADSIPALTVHGPYARDNLPEILAGLDGVAAPSRWEEVFGLSVREARAAGLPVLVSSAGALPDIVGEDQSGAEQRGAWIVARDDWAAWAEVLREFAGSGERGAGSTAPRSTEAMMLQLERAYVEVIVETTGSMPELVHPFEDLAPRSAPVKAGLFGRLKRAFGAKN